MAQFVCIVSQVVTSGDMGEYKFVLTMSGVQCVMTSGMTKMPMLSVECWDTQLMV